jgi:translation elongation factor EF-1beta
MLKYELVYIKPYGDEREVLSFNIPEPYALLNIMQGVYYNVQDVELYIEWLKEEIIDKNIPDYSLENGIEFQPILFGSKKSKIAEYIDGKIIGGQEFDTKDFLEVCYAWRDFLKERV